MQWCKTATKNLEKNQQQFRIIKLSNMQLYKTAITKFGNKNCMDKHICFVYAKFWRHTAYDMFI